MGHLSPSATVIIMGSVVLYIAFTSWLTYRLRSKSNADYMVGSRALPAIVVGVLLMSEFIGAKSTVGTAQEAFNSGMAATWSVLGASIGFLLFGLFFGAADGPAGKVAAGHHKAVGKILVVGVIEQQ